MSELGKDFGHIRGFSRTVFVFDPILNVSNAVLLYNISLLQSVFLASTNRTLNSVIGCFSLNGN